MNILETITLVFNSIGVMECIAVVLFSLIVLQEVLHKCSTGLRIAFTIFPIAATLHMIDFLVTQGNYSVSTLILYIGVLISLNWIWNQRNLFHEFEDVLIENAQKHRGFFSIDELRCIVCCVAVAALKHVGYNPTLSSKVCLKITEDRRKHPR